MGQRLRRASGGCDNIVWGSDASGTIVFGDLAADGTITQVPLGQLTDGQLLKLMISWRRHAGATAATTAATATRGGAASDDACD